MNFNVADEADASSGYFMGGFEDAGLDGAPADKPNSAVLNYPSGVVLEGVAGTEVQIEGFARRVRRAYPEDRILLGSRSDVDHAGNAGQRPGSTGRTGRMGFTPPSEGAYLLDIRTTSLRPMARSASTASTPSSC